jgi:transposase
VAAATVTHAAGHRRRPKDRGSIPVIEGLDRVHLFDIFRGAGVAPHEVVDTALQRRYARWLAAPKRPRVVRTSPRGPREP